MSNHEKHEKTRKQKETREHAEHTEVGKVIPAGGEVLIYKTDDGQARVDVRLVNESLWMTQSDMALLFQCSADNISLHLKNIYDEGELSREATAEEFSVVRKEGSRAVRRQMLFYNLDAVTSVG